MPSVTSIPTIKKTSTLTNTFFSIVFFPIKSFTYHSINTFQNGHVLIDFSTLTAFLIILNVSCYFQTLYRILMFSIAICYIIFNSSFCWAKYIGTFKQLRTTIQFNDRNVVLKWDKKVDHIMVRDGFIKLNKTSLSFVF